MKVLQEEDEDGVGEVGHMRCFLVAGGAIIVSCDGTVFVVPAGIVVSADVGVSATTKAELLGGASGTITGTGTEGGSVIVRLTVLLMLLELVTLLLLLLLLLAARCDSIISRRLLRATAAASGATVVAAVIFFLLLLLLLLLECVS